MEWGGSKGGFCEVCERGAAGYVAAGIADHEDR